MDVDEDDDFYAPTEDVPTGDLQAQMRSRIETKVEEHDEDLEEGEEEDEGEDEGSDSVRTDLSWTQESALTRVQGYRHYHRKERWHQSSPSFVSAA